MIDEKAGVVKWLQAADVDCVVYISTFSQSRWPSLADLELTLLLSVGRLEGSICVLASQKNSCIFMSSLLVVAWGGKKEDDLICG